MSNSLIRMLKIAELYFQTKDACGFKQICTQFNAYIKRHAHMEPRQDKNQPNPWKRNMDYAGYENSPYYGSVSEFLEKFPGGIKEWVIWRQKTKGERNSMYDDLLPKSKVKTAEIDFEDQVEPEEYKPTPEEKEESVKPPTPEEFKESKTLVEKILEELMGNGLVSEEDVDEWRKSQPLKIEQKAHYEPVGGDDVAKFEKEPHFYADIDKFKSIKEFLKQYRKEGQSADDAAMRAAKDFVDYWKLLLKGKKRRKGK